MACFIAPAVEAIVTTAVSHSLKVREKKAEAQGIALEAPKHSKFLSRLGWLNSMLWGGSLLLAFEHVWHGEVTPWFPFLTAAGNPADASAMLHEMATAGVGMALLVTAVWAGLVVAADAIAKRPAAVGSR